MGHLEGSGQGLDQKEEELRGEEAQEAMAERPRGSPRPHHQPPDQDGRVQAHEAEDETISV